MDLIMLLLVIAIIGFVVWLITTYIPMPAPFKTVIWIVAAIVICLYLLRVLAPNLPNVL